MDIIYHVHPQPSYTPEEVESHVLPNSVPEEPVDGTAIPPSTSHDDAVVSNIFRSDNTLKQ